MSIVAENEFATVVYVPRKGYELKTWLYEDLGEHSYDEMVEFARNKFRQIGVPLFENDTFEFDPFTSK